MKIKAENKALRQQAGYTLVELSITVAIIAVLVMTGLYGVPRILATNNISTLSKQVVLATANYSKVNSMSGNSSTKTFADTTVASTGISTVGAMGIWPTEALTLDSTGTVTAIRHPFGGKIDSQANSNALTGVTVGSGYWIRLAAIPAAQCFDVSASLIGQASSLWITDGSETTYAEPKSTDVAGSFSPKAPGAAADLVMLSKACTKPNNTAATTTTRNVYALYVF